MWNRREREPCLDVARVLRTREGDRRVDVCWDQLQRDICNRGSEMFVACIFVQRHEAAAPRRGDEIPPLFCIFQQHSRSFVFRADMLCCWSDGSVLTRFLLRNHCCVGTFIRIDFLLPFCCAAHSICPIQICLVSTRPCATCCMAQAVASKSIGSVVLSALSLHAHLIAGWTPRYVCSPLRSRAIARAQRVTNTLSGSGATVRA